MSRKRQELIQVLVTIEEKTQAETQAKAYGYASVADYIRSMLEANKVEAKEVK